MSRRLIFIGLLLGIPAAVFLLRSKQGENSGHVEPGAELHQIEEPSGGGSRSVPTPSRLGSSGEHDDTIAGSVRGHVIDAATGEPVPFVDIVFRKSNEESAATSDESGAYEAALGAGRYEIRAIGEGMIAKALPTLSMGRAPEVRLDIPVTRLATLRGKVVDPNGHSVANVELLLRSDTALGLAFPHRGEIGATTSATDGSFEILVPPGEADLEAKLGATTVFATMPMVESGATLDELRIVMDRRAAIRGSVTIPGGGPAVGAEVLLSYRREGTSAFENRVFTTDGAGAFEALDLVPQTYVLEATHKQHAPSGPQLVALSPDLLELAVQLELSTPVSISGRVIDGEGRPVGNALVAQVWEESKQRFTKLETYSDGKFNFDGLGPGPHKIRARKEGYAETTVKGVKAPQLDLELVLVAMGGIEGKVSDSQGRPIERFTVTYSGAAPSDEHSVQFGSEDGSFQAYPVASGTYKVRIVSSSGELSLSKDVVVPAGAYGDATMVLVGK